MKKLNLFFIIMLAVVTANTVTMVINRTVDHYRYKELNELKLEKLRLQIELRKRILKNDNL